MDLELELEVDVDVVWSDLMSARRLHTMAYALSQGAHRPVCGGRWLVVHVGSMNCVPWNFLLIVPPVAIYVKAGPVLSPRTIQRPFNRLARSAALQTLPRRELTRRGWMLSSQYSTLPAPPSSRWSVWRCSWRLCRRQPSLSLGSRSANHVRRATDACLLRPRRWRSVTLLAAHLTEPGILPTLIEDDAVYRPARTSAPQRYWPIGLSSEPDFGKRAGRADASKARVVVLDGEHHALKDFRAKVCRETEVAVENFDHFCPWIGNVRPLFLSALSRLTVVVVSFPHTRRRGCAAADPVGRLV